MRHISIMRKLCQTSCIDGDTERTVVTAVCDKPLQSKEATSCGRLTICQLYDVAPGVCVDRHSVC